MARRRTARRKTITRYVTKYRKAKRSNGMGVVTANVLGGGIYGAGRQYLNQLLAPVTAKIPGGVYADNITLGIADFLIWKYSSGILKKTALTGLAIESAMLGSDITSGFSGTTGTTGTNW